VTDPLTRKPNLGVSNTASVIAKRELATNHDKPRRCSGWVPRYAGYTGDPSLRTAFLSSAFLSSSILAMTLKYSAWKARHFGQR
jgi:hypothetical protein